MSPSEGHTYETERSVSRETQRVLFNKIVTLCPVFMVHYWDMYHLLVIDVL